MASPLDARVLLVGSGAEGTGPTLLLTTHRLPRFAPSLAGAALPPTSTAEAIFFNIGECACRVANEARVRVLATTAVALTRAAPSHIAGLPSLLFHLADGGAAALDVIGPGPHSGAAVRAMRTFVERRHPAVNVREDMTGTSGGELPLCVHDSRAEVRYGGWGGGTTGALGVRVWVVPVGEGTLVPLAGAGAGAGTKRPRSGEAEGGGVQSCDGSHPPRQRGELIGDGSHPPRQRGEMIGDGSARGGGFRCYIVAVTGPAIDSATEARGASAGPPLGDPLPAAPAATHPIGDSSEDSSSSSSSEEEEPPIPERRRGWGEGPHPPPPPPLRFSHALPAVSPFSTRAPVGGIASQCATTTASFLVIDVPAAQHIAPTAAALASAWAALTRFHPDLVPPPCNAPPLVAFHLSPHHVTSDVDYVTLLLSPHAIAAKHVLCNTGGSTSPIVTPASVAGAGAECSDVTDGGGAHHLTATHFPSATLQTLMLHAASPIPSETSGWGSYPLLLPLKASPVCTTAPPSSVMLARPLQAWSVFPALSNAHALPPQLPARTLQALERQEEDGEKACLDAGVLDGGCAPLVSHPLGLIDVAGTLAAFRAQKVSEKATAPAAVGDGNASAAATLRLAMRGGVGAAPAVAAAPAPVAPPAFSLPCTGGASTPPFVLFLGTGAAAPSKLRSCSAIYFSLGPTSLLLDCGEGALGKLLLQESPSGSGGGNGSSSNDEVVLGIGLVWVSHLHADHHTGLLTLLGAHLAARIKRASASGGAHPQPPPLAIVGPPALGAIIAAYADLAFDSAVMQHVPQALQPSHAAAAASIQGDGKVHAQALATATDAVANVLSRPCYTFAALGGEGGDAAALKALMGSRGSDSGDGRFFHALRLRSVRVEHCRDAFGCVLSLVRGVRGQQQQQLNSHSGGLGASGALCVLYSGDTRPCAALVQAGAEDAAALRGAQWLPPPRLLLIHEATFDDSRAQEAARKRHSTAAEAMGVGAALVHACAGGAGSAPPVGGALVLTHFSARYASHGACVEGSGSGGGEARAPSCSLRVLYAADLLRIELGSV